MPLNASARQALAHYAAPFLHVEPTLAAVATTWPRRQRGVPSLPLWRSQKGGRLSPQAIRRVIDELVRSAAARGLVPADASAHTLRHTFGRSFGRLVNASLDAACGQAQVFSPWRFSRPRPG